MRSRRHISWKNGFTLLEVIISIALMGILVTASAGIVANVALIWEKSDGIATLDRHLAGLDRFLSRLCEEQETTQIGTSSDNISIVGTTWSVPAGLDGNYFPQFSINEIYPVLQVAETPAPALTAWLFWDKDGLWLITQTPRQKAENESLVNYVLLSEYLDSATILVWDSSSEAWEAVDSVSDEDLQSPSIRLRLKFKQDRREREMTVTLSKTAPGGISY